MNVKKFLSKMDDFYKEQLTTMAAEPLSLNILKDMDLDINDLFKNKDYINKMSLNTLTQYDSIFLTPKDIVDKGFNNMFKSVIVYKTIKQIKKSVEFTLFPDLIMEYMLNNNSIQKGLLDEFYNRLIELRDENFILSMIMIKDTVDIIMRNLPYFKYMLATSDKTGIIRSILDNENIIDNEIIQEKQFLISIITGLVFDKHIFNKDIVNMILSSHLINIQVTIDKDIKTIYDVKSNKKAQNFIEKLQMLNTIRENTTVPDMIDESYKNVINYIKDNKDYIDYIKKSSKTIFNMMQELANSKLTMNKETINKFKDVITSDKSDEFISRDMAEKLMQKIVGKDEPDENVTFDDEL